MLNLTPEEMLARKRKQSARRSKRYRLRVKSRNWWRKRIQFLVNREHKNGLAWIKAHIKELYRKKHASSKQGFIDGWHSTADLQNAEQWSKRYRKAFAEARTARAKFEQQMHPSNAKPGEECTQTNEPRSRLNCPSPNRHDHKGSILNLC